MKSISLKIASLLIAVFLLNGCGETEKFIYNGDLFISFTGETEGNYTVLAQNAPYPMEVGIPFPVEEDLVIDLEVIYATGTEGVHFDLPSSITIGKGEVVAGFYVYGLSANMVDRKDTLIIGLGHEKAATFSNEYTLYMQPPCEFVIDEYIGEWTAYEQSDYEEEPYDPYTINLETNPNGGDTLILTGLWPGEPFKVVFNTENPADYTWNIPDQFLLEDLSGYGETRISDLGPGNVFTCEHILIIKYLIYVSEGDFERATLQLEKN
jgi:hypothetical protein